MAKYIFKRIILMVPVILCVAILVFTMMYFAKGDPATLIAGNTATQERVAEVREQLGLNDSYLVRLGRFLGQLVQGNLGTSYVLGTDVLHDLSIKLPHTLRIAFFSIICSSLIGIPIGIRSAVKANTLEDRFSMFITMLGVSMPNFWLGILLVMLFSLKLGILPSNGIGGWKYYVLPIVSTAISGLAGTARLARSSMLEVIRADYITTARAKGVSEHGVIYKHALGNALIPIVTAIGGNFAGAMGGTVVIETVYSIPGIGTYLINGISNRDYTVVQGSILMIAVIFSLVMLAVDVAYAFIDPRIKAQYESQNKKRAKKEDKAV